MATGLTIVGLTLNLIGVLLLFRYAMPYRLAQIHEGSIFDDPPTEKDRRLNRRYSMLGKIGVAAIATGTLSQAGAQFR